MRGPHTLLMHPIEQPRTVGRFLLSPLTRKTDCGHYLASVSIRSGQGSGTHDRVLRFVPSFDTARAAARYAVEQGMDYLRQHQGA